MNEVRAVHALWKRETIRFVRDRLRITSSIVSPALWLIIFGSGLGYSITTFNYQKFLLPGIVAQTMLFTSMYLAISLIWDRQFGFMKEMLIAPVGRVSIFIGKMFGIGTNVMLQGFIVIILGILIGISLSFNTVILSLILMLFITAGLVSIGLIIASAMTTLESFGAIVTFINMPMFFLSGALFPVTNIPSWLEWAVYLNPLTYCVDALRSIMLIGWQPILPLGYDMGIIIIFDAVMITIGTYMFNRMQ
jgi:ABC-2 type transport system permease protein